MLKKKMKPYETYRVYLTMFLTNLNFKIMKKLMILVSAVALSSTMFAQDQVSKGKILIEANTGNAMIGSTNFGFLKLDEFTTFSLGLDGGYCIMDNLALKAGLGYSSEKYGDADAETAINYRLGAKYYAMSKIPVTLDVTGASTEADEDPMWLGIGAGYAFFLGDNVSIEPGLRYNMSLNSDYSEDAVIQFNVGFALHF
jgi:opacity protein-like surface antigen